MQWKTDELTVQPVWQTWHCRSGSSKQLKNQKNQPVLHEATAVAYPSNAKASKCTGKMDHWQANKKK